MKTLLHLLYFLPALIVYGVWTWYSWKYMEEIRYSYDRWIIGSYLIVHSLLAIVYIIMVSMDLIKYFSN